MTKDWNWIAVPDAAADLFKSNNQRKVLSQLKQGKMQKDIAKENGVSFNAVMHTVARMKATLSKHGCDPEHDYQITADAPFILNNKTVHRKRNPETGELEVHQIWDKPGLQKQNQIAAFEAAIDSLCGGITPFKKVPAPKKTEGELLTDYTITDFHLGMYAWHLETGQDWDMDIAEAVILNAVADMMDRSPDSEQAIFSQLGDLLHWDGMLAVTPMNKHILDADTRFDLLVESAMNVCAKAIEMLLHKHKSVHVIHAEGNHDMASSSWLRRATSREFRDNPRVTVETSPFPFYKYLWGKTFLGWHHGHLQKMESLPLLFSTEPRFREDFGKSEYVYIKTGHRHQKEVIEKGGVIVEQVETLAARDAYAARGFPYSQRGTIAVTYSKEAGEVSRATVRPRVDEKSVLRNAV